MVIAGQMKQEEPGLSPLSFVSHLDLSREDVISAGVGLEAVIIISLMLTLLP